MENINRVISFLKTVRLGWLVPFILLARGENPKEQLRAIFTGVCIPIFAIVAFMIAWSVSSQQIVTKFGTVPGPGQVVSAWGSLQNEARLEKVKEQDYLNRNRQKRLDSLTKYEDVLADMPGGSPEFTDLGAVESSLAKSDTIFREANELLEVANKVTSVKAVEDAQAVIDGFEFESSKELGSTVTERLLPLEIAYAAAEEELRMSEEFNVLPDDSEEVAETKAALAKRRAKTLASEKADLLIERQKIATIATKSSLDAIRQSPVERCVGAPHL